MSKDKARLAEEHEKTGYKLMAMTPKYVEILAKVERAGFPEPSYDDMAKVLSKDEIDFTNHYEGSFRYQTWLESEIIEVAVQSIGKQFWTEPDMNAKTIKLFCVKCDTSETWQTGKLNPYAAQDWCRFHLITAECN